MLSPFEWWCRNFILPDICKPCLFVFLRNLFYLTLKGGTRQVVKAEIRLWYFCGQTRNRRGFYHGDFHFGGPNRDRTDDLTDANRTLSQLSYAPICLLCDYKIFFSVCQVLRSGLEKFFFAAPLFHPIGLQISTQPSGFEYFSSSAGVSSIMLLLLPQAGNTV